MTRPAVTVMLPAYNEEGTVGDVVSDVHNVLDKEGYEHEVLVVNDGSQDDTANVAEAAGATVVSHNTNKGLGMTFATGLRHAIQTDADIIVNMDADGQHDPQDLPKLVEAVEGGEADMVIGARSIANIESMPLGKKLGNRIGSVVTSMVAGVRVRDAQSGYRAMTRDVAAKMNLLSTYTYVQESIIQAAHKGHTVAEVPIDVKAREDGNSRLIHSLKQYIWNAASIVIRTYRDFKPMKTFGFIALLFFGLAAIPGAFVLRNWLATGQFELVGSALLVVLFSMIGIWALLFGLLADMFRRHRKLQEEILRELRQKDGDY